MDACHIAFSSKGSCFRAIFQEYDLGKSLYEVQTSFTEK